MVGEVTAGLPILEIPEVDVTTVRALFPTALALALVQLLTITSLGRVFAAKHRYSISPNRELVAIGPRNFA